MASLNTAARELVLKIVYYGPGLCGKTTSLQSLHEAAPAERRGKLVSLATPVDRTLYFDFLPLRLPPMRGLSVRLQLFTVPGQVYFNATRRLVLSGADGIVFVADSQLDRLDANLESLENLRENLAEHGRDLAAMPHVFAWNKRDLDGLVPLDELEKALNRHGAPGFATVATRGVGIEDALQKITALVLSAYEAQIPSSPGALHTGGTITLAPPTVAVRRPSRPRIFAEMPSASPSRPSPAQRASEKPAKREDDDVVTTAASKRTPIDAETAEVVTSSTLLAPSEGTVLIEAQRLEASLTADAAESARGYQRGPDSKESVVGEWNAEEAEEDGAPTRRFEPRAILPITRATPPPPPSDDDADVREPEPSSKVPSPSQQRTTAVGSPPLAGMGVGDQISVFSFASLFDPTERAAVEAIEAAIAHGAHADAVSLCDAALTRVLSTIQVLMQGENAAAGNSALYPLLIGLDGRRYLAFRAVARRARQVGDLGVRDALEAYAFLLEAKVAASQWDALRSALGASSAAPPPPRPSQAPPSEPPLPRGSFAPSSNDVGPRPSPTEPPVARPPEGTSTSPQASK